MILMIKYFLIFNGETPFFLICGRFDGEILDFFYNKGANIETKTLSFRKPIHQATERFNLMAIKWLIEKKVELFPKTRSGKTPLDFAKEKGFDEAVILFNSIIKNNMI